MDNKKNKLLEDFLERNPNPEKEKLVDFLKSIELSEEEISTLAETIITPSKIDLDGFMEVDCCEMMISDIDEPFDLPDDIVDELKTQEDNDSKTEE